MRPLWHWEISFCCFKKRNVPCAAWLLWGVQFAPAVSGLPGYVCVFGGWTPFWDTLFPLPNCFLLSEQKLQTRQSGPRYFKLIQNHKPGHGWVQFSVTLWQFTPGKICLALFWIPAITNPRDVTAFSKKLQFSLSQRRVKSCGFPKGFCSIGPISPEGSGLSDKRALTSRQYSWKFRVWKVGAL